MAVRYDTGELSKPVRQPNGWLRADGYITRTGVFKYRRADGSTIREYRSPEEVFHPDSLASFEHVPLTDDHPSVGLLDDENTHEFQRGTVIAPKPEGDKVRAQFLVTDAKAIKKSKSGKTQLSCGYVCDLDETPGVTPEGEHYDARQINIRGNHVALVAAGRAGPEVRLRADAAFDVSDEVGQYSTIQPIQIESGKEISMTKFKIDGVDFEMSETAAQALMKVFGAHEAQVATAKADADKSKAEAEKARADADKAKDDAEKLRAELKDAPAKALAAAKSRADLEQKATEILGGEDKFDGLSDGEVKALVIAQEMPKLKLDGKSADYVDAMFDRIVADFSAETEENDSPIPHQDERDPVSAAQAKYQEALKKVAPR